MPESRLDRRNPSRSRACRAALPAGLAAFSLALAAHATPQPEDAAPVTRPALSEPTLQELGESPIATLLQSLDDQTRRYHDHITTLANPFFEGRAPGVRGNTLAAEYIAFYFKQFGLKPAFASVDRSSEGIDVLSPNADYFQPFSTGSETTLESATFTAGGLGELTHGTDFAALGFSGDAAVTDAPLVFVGYALNSGRQGYTSFEEDTDLTGKVALVLRFEPMDDAGQSLWLPGGWTPNAGVEGKFRACERRGAAGIILVNPPGADDDRMGRLESIDSLSPGFGGTLDIPVVQVSEAFAERLVRRADPEGRSLMELRRLADAGPAIIDLPDQPVSIAVDLDESPTMTQNVGGLLPGRGDLADQIIVIGAHYDHVGYGYFGSRAGAAGAGVLHPGADDNGSGTSGMLLAAEALSKAYADLPDDAQARSILFLAFSGEELGLLGSAHYVSDPIAPIDRHAFMLNMDMIGRLRDGVMELGGVRTADGLWEFLEPKVQASGLDVRPLPGGVGPSDHTNFFNAGMPVLFFHTLLHDEYHMPSDFSWTINHVGAVRVANLCIDVALDLATRPDRFVRGSGATRPARPYLGITGEDNPGGGVLIITVGDDTPASRAGLQEGDIIIKWESTEVEDQGQWRPLLQERRPGDEVRITVRRDGKELTLTCTLGQR